MTAASAAARTTEPSRPSRASLGLLALALATIAIALWPSLRGEFVYDDLALIRQNPALRSWSELVESWSHPYWDFARPEGMQQTGYWRPLTSFALYCAYQAGDGTPFAFHALSLALHLACATVAFALARSITRSDFAGLVAAVTFGLHPVQVEAVAWISAVNDPLAGLFVLSGAWAFWRWRQSGSQGVPLAPALMLLMGALAKESALALVVICAALDVARSVGGGGGLRPLVRAYAPFAAAFAAYYLLRVAAFDAASAGFGYSNAHLALEPGRETSLRVEMLGGYLGLLAAPVELNLFRDARPAIPWNDHALWRAAAAIAIWLVATAWAWRKRASGALVGLGWMVAAVAPLFWDLETLGRCPISERFLYVAVFGVALLAGDRVQRASSAPARWILVAVLVAVFGIQSRARTSFWRDEMTLFTASAEASPKSPYVHWGLGRVLLQRFRETGEGDLLQRAMAAFTRSQDLGAKTDETPTRDPSVLVTIEDRLQANLGYGWCFLLCEIYLPQECPGGEAAAVFEHIYGRFPRAVEAYVGRGMAHVHAGELDLAAGALHRATEINDKSREAWFNLGLVEAQRGNLGAAAVAFERARSIDPTDADTLIELASALADTGENDRALRAIDDALRIAPNDPRASQIAGVLAAKARKLDEALGWFERALAIDGNFGAAHLERARILAAQGQLDRAFNAFERACQTMPASFEAHYHFGTFLGGQGLATEALPYLQRALAIAPQAPQAAEIQREIERLKAEQPPK